MANEIAYTAAQVGLVDPLNATVKTYLAGATITKGQVVALNTDGGVHPADASAGGGYLYEQVVGVALSAGGAGQAIDVVSVGEIYGFTVSGMNSGDLVYVSDTVGRLSTVAGTVTVIVGRISPLADQSVTEVIRMDVLFGVAKAA
jgi:hypothetical protein